MKSNQIKTFLFRVLIYALGLLFLAFSVAFSRKSGLGVSPINSFPCAVSVSTGLPLKLCINIVFSCYILLQIVLLGRAFKWYNLFQIAFSMLFSEFTNYAVELLNGITVSTYLAQIGMLAIGILLIAVGITLYVSTDLIPMPSEGLTLACAQRFKIQFSNMKIIIDCISVSLAVLITLLCLGHVEEVREGTVIAALLVGKVIAIVQKPIRPFVRRICGLEQ